MTTDKRTVLNEIRKKIDKQDFINKGNKLVNECLNIVKKGKKISETKYAKPLSELEEEVDLEIYSCDKLIDKCHFTEVFMDQLYTLNNDDYPDVISDLLDYLIEQSDKLDELKANIDSVVEYEETHENRITNTKNLFPIIAGIVAAIFIVFLYVFICSL